MPCYEFDEIWDRLDNFYLFNERFAELLCSSLAYLNRECADSILDSCLFFPFSGGSWHLSPSLIRGRSVVIIDESDLEDRNEAIVTILHEAAHAYLGHNESRGYSGHAMRQVEDDAWAQVRRWLPNGFTLTIEEAERQGSGGKGENGAGVE